MGPSETPLCVAVQYNAREMVKLLISNKADVNLMKKKEITPLHYACKVADPWLANELINAGANVNAVHNDFSPLAYAAAGKELLSICD